MILGRSAARAWAFVPAALLFSGVLGCGGNSAAAARKALPSQYPSVRNNWHGIIERVEFKENFSLDDYSELVIVPIDTSQTPMPPKDNTYVPVKEALERCTYVVSQGIESKLTSTPVTVAPSTVPAGRIVVLRGTITEMNPGSQAARYWVGFGAGSAGTRLSAELVDGPSGRVLLRLKDGAVAPGGMFGGGYRDLLDANMKVLGRDIGVLLTGFSPRAAAAKK